MKRSEAVEKLKSCLLDMNVGRIFNKFEANHILTFIENELGMQPPMGEFVLKEVGKVPEVVYYPEWEPES